jgi:DNA replication licensing factor MCM2
MHGPFDVTGDRAYPPAFCAACNSRSSFEIDDATTVYRNYQRITIQEPPSSVPPGRLPRTKEVVLFDDNAGRVRPGEEIDITGVYKHVMRTKPTGFPVFSTIIEANYVLKSGDEYASLSITEAEKDQIMELSRDPNIAKRIFNTIAPSIHGHDDIKAAIALSLFGGTRIQKKDGHVVRGDINVILLGDPGTAKSQFLKFAHDIAPRSVYTTGKGASAVGLTAAVTKDHSTGEYTIEGGALVLADSGVCVIDEFDKMSDKDRTSLHEAMEQQTISISKGGIVTTLQARCSVIAACNPTHDRYQPSLSFLENSGLTEPILSRFDVICVVRDIVDFAKDQDLARFVCLTHKGDTPQPQDAIPQDLLKKYISYARANYNPTVSASDEDKFASLFADLRKKSEEYGGQSITVRNLESLIRLTEAHARLHLRNNITNSDTEFAIKMVINSFISTQKYSAQKNIRKSLEHYITRDEDKDELLIHLVRQMINERVSFLVSRRGQADADIGEIRIKKSEFENRARGLNFDNVENFYSSKLIRDGGFSTTATEIIRPAS